jgi:hypothetical protein
MTTPSEIDLLLQWLAEIVTGWRDLLCRTHGQQPLNFMP